MKVNVAVVGYGYWGPNLARNFAKSDEFNLISIVEPAPDRAKKAANDYPSVEIVDDIEKILRDPTIHAVAIATPVHTHFDLVKACIAECKHVWVEKPLAEKYKNAQALESMAFRYGVVLLVDHTFLYTSAVKAIAELIDDGELGQLRYFDSTRINLGLFQRDVSVIFDLAVHDISILLRLHRQLPDSVSCVGHSHLPGKPADMAFLTLAYSPAINFIAHINVSWVSPIKVRRTFIGGANKVVLYDDVEIDRKLQIFDSAADIDPITAQISYRNGDIFIPRLDNRAEALHNVVNDFAIAIKQNRKPISNGQFACDVVRILEAAEKSMSLGGAPIAIEYE